MSKLYAAGGKFCGHCSQRIKDAVARGLRLCPECHRILRAAPCKKDPSTLVFAA